MCDYYLFESLLDCLISHYLPFKLYFCLKDYKIASILNTYIQRNLKNFMEKYPVISIWFISSSNNYQLCMGVCRQLWWYSVWQKHHSRMSTGEISTRLIQILPSFYFKTTDNIKKIALRSESPFLILSYFASLTVQKYQFSYLV